MADKKIPPEKVFTREELQKAVNRQRRIMFLVSPASRKPKKVFGKELFWDTSAGKVRVLFNNYDCDEVRPVHFNIHGGGFNTSFPEVDDKYMQMFSDKLGIKVINIDYTLAPEAQFPVAMNQCKAVVEYAKAHAEELKIDTERMSIGGYSAGGNLSAAVILSDPERTLGIKGCIIAYAPMDIYTDPYLKPSPKGCIPPQAARIADPCYFQDKEGRKNPLISPAFSTVDFVKGFPPTYVATASQDSLCQEGEKFKDTLIAAGVDVIFKRYEGEKHGFTHYKGAAADECWEEQTAFLKRVLTD